MADDLYQRDTLVLQHLRGYPEELRHYSNLIKQAHPRGMSALDFVLRRPAASDSFIAAICRLVAAGEAVLSAVEGGERFGGPPPRRSLPMARSGSGGPATWRSTGSSMGKLRLLVTCKRCGREFDTGRRMDRRSFEKGTLAANYHTCPHCGTRETYRKGEYRTFEEAPSPARPGRPTDKDDNHGHR